MSPVSPVFYTVVTVSIGLKNVLRVRASILQYYMSMFQRQSIKILLHLLTSAGVCRGTRAVETQFQTGNPDPYPLHQRRTDVGQT